MAGDVADVKVMEVAVAALVVNGARIALAVEVADAVMAADVVSRKAACNTKSEMCKMRREYFPK